MRLIFLGMISLFSLSAMSFANTSMIISPSEPTNLSQIKQQLIQYQQSGDYYHTISKEMHKAMYYLKFRINQNHYLQKPHKLAIVLDIDETSLSNYPDLQRLDFGGTHEQNSAAIAVGHDRAIPYTHTLYSYARSHGVRIFFITGRYEWQRKATETNLKNVGYTDWAGLFMRPNNAKAASVIPYKSTMRRKIEREGYDIILNIGDQKSDLAQGHADMAVKLPNPYYFIA